MDIREKTRHILQMIISHRDLHLRWLYTLSYLENCGARKIARYEPGNEAPLSLLKHAAEEFRHAYFFKRQILRLTDDVDRKRSLLGGMKAKNYLNLLDVRIARLLKDQEVETSKLKEATYLLTTYAIEERAIMVYPLYQELLEQHESSISVKSVIAEEDLHLEEMKSGIIQMNLESFKRKALLLEATLYDQFLSWVENEIVELSLHESYLAVH